MIANQDYWQILKQLYYNLPSHDDALRGSPT